MLYNKKIGFINNSKELLKFDFEYEKIEDSGVNIKNINKSEILKDYDFILIYDKKCSKNKNE